MKPGNPRRVSKNSTEKEFMMKLAILKEMFEFLMKNKKYWLIPIIIVLLLIGILIVLSEGTAIAPFIYTLF
jgi:hypothetical protein